MEDGGTFFWASTECSFLNDQTPDSKVYRVGHPKDPLSGLPDRNTKELAFEVDNMAHRPSQH